MKKQLKYICLLLIITLSLCTTAYAADDDDPRPLCAKYPASSVEPTVTIHK